MYITPGQGKSWSQFLFQTIQIQPNCQFTTSFVLYMTFYNFPHSNAWATQVDLAVNRSRSSKGHDLYKLCRALLSDASCQVSKSLAFWFWRRKFLKGFAIYSHGGHLGHVTLTVYTNFHSLFLRMLHIKFGFDWPSGFREEDV